jgi:hypothetical protein
MNHPQRPALLELSISHCRACIGRDSCNGTVKIAQAIQRNAFGEDKLLFWTIKLNVPDLLAIETCSIKVEINRARQRKTALTVRKMYLKIRQNRECASGSGKACE